ncbi:recombinase RecT [Romboutsia sp.]|uniref:recombinase RecT n=1 Tax=Romboutsia sp. TaxID=1965302 RepID=UPI003F3B6073
MDNYIENNCEPEDANNTGVTVEEKYKKLYEEYSKIHNKYKSLLEENINLKESIVNSESLLPVPNLKNNELSNFNKESSFLTTIDPEMTTTQRILKYKYPKISIENADLCFIHALIKQNNFDLLSNDIYVTEFKGRITTMISIKGLRKIASRNMNYSLTILFVIRLSDGSLQKTDIIDGTDNLVGCKATVDYYDKDKNTFTVSRYVKLKDYDTKNNLWVSKKTEMIQKVAEASVLRAVCPETSSLYLKEEFDKCEKDAKQPKQIIDTTDKEPKNVTSDREQ